MQAVGEAADGRVRDGVEGAVRVRGGQEWGEPAAEADGVGGVGEYTGEGGEEFDEFGGDEGTRFVVIDSTSRAGRIKLKSYLQVESDGRLQFR